MSFTPEERRQWHEQKRRRENGNGNAHDEWEGNPASVCLHCGNPFGAGNGVVTEDAAICDICLGD